MNRLAIALGVAGISILASAASAHHSYAMFDREKNLALSGTIEAFKWNNPHSWIAFKVANPKGGIESWGVEMTSPAVLARAGWRSTTLKPGDLVVITVHPLRSGELGGAFVSVQLPDGRVLTDKPGKS